MILPEINLLPWRDIQRRKLHRNVLILSVMLWVAAAAAVAYGHFYTSSLISQQQARNNYLTGQIKKLDMKLGEIRTIRKQKQALIDRMDVIQQLQGDRTRIVHVFDELVRRLPKGVYFTRLKKNGDKLIIKGYAQSNARVSALMNQLEASRWLSNAKLNVINASRRGGNSLSQFSIKITQQKQPDTPSGAVAQR